MPQPLFQAFRREIYAEILTNALKEPMALLAKAQWKAASEKELASLKNNKANILLPATSLSTGHKIIGSRLVYKVKSDNSHKRHLVLLGWEKSSGIDCGSTFAPVCRLQSTRVVLAISEECNLECWQQTYSTTFSDCRCHRGSVRQDGTQT